MINPQTILDSASLTSSGACVVSLTDLPAESLATLHSLNSREAGGWRANIEKIFDGSGKIIERVLRMFYIGYGHRSIGDCGSADVFLDDVSILLANHFEHWPLFSGQETSTRYVDLSNTTFVLTGNPQIDEWSERWFEFYKEHLPTVIDFIRDQNPCPDADQKTTWEKATKARACDIMASFLVTSVRTNFSMHFNLRQFSDVMASLRHHPLSEMRDAAEAAIVQLQRDHPNSFAMGPKKGESEETWQAREQYRKNVAQYVFGTHWQSPTRGWHMEADFGNRDILEFVGGSDLLDRPAFTELPAELRGLGSIHVQSLIDFRSFRDLHRQRSAQFRIPVLKAKYGFEEWYLDQLPYEIREKAQNLIGLFTQETENVGDSLEWQYATPMGFKVPCFVEMPLNAAVYIAELRTGSTVHPTARAWAHQLADSLLEKFPAVPLHIDRSPDGFQIKRGKHDIVRKEE